LSYFGLRIGEALVRRWTDVKHDKCGPALIASTYGDVRPEHLVRQALRIRFRNDEAKLPQ
jgi:hypothetical protein